jgi:PAS domain S-box-containing protein
MSDSAASISSISSADPSSTQAGNGTVVGSVIRSDGAAALFAGSGEMRERCRRFDWSATPLGPVEQWSAALRTVVGLVLASPLGMIVLWGPDLVQIYNDAYRAVMGAKHPSGLGQPTRECWPEVWAFNAPLYDGVLQRGESFTFADQRLVIDRHGRPEEAFFTLTYSPLPDDGSVGGVLVTVQETTVRVRAETAQEREREDLLAGERAAIAELRAVLESMPDAVYIGGPRGIRLANQAALDQLGFASREELNRSVDTLAAEIQTRDAETGEFIPGDQQAFTRALLGERVVQNVVVRHRTAREDRVLRCAAAPVVVEGSVVAAVAVNTDVTEQVRARREVERLLAESERARAVAEALHARTEAVLESIADAFYLVDRDWRFTYVNDAAEPLLHTTRERLLGRTLWEAFPDVTGSPFEGPYRDAMENGRVTSAEAYFAPLGTWFDVHTYPWKGGLMVHFRDIGARVAAQAERERLLADAEAARAEAEGANRAKSEFLAVMSHELRTPLNAIGGYAELIELGIHGPVTDAQRMALARIQASQRHLLGLIAGVLDYSRVEAGAVAYQLTDVPVGEAIAQAESLVAPQLRAKGLGYAWSGAPPELSVRADREKLQQILLNLLGNAVKFTDSRGSAPGRIEVTCTITDAASGRPGSAPATAGRCVQLHVRDTGVGIAPEKLASVFEPFVQVDQRLTRPHEGVGLGLAISRDLARGMGGDLTAESVVGAGSTFTLTLPAA